MDGKTFKRIREESDKNFDFLCKKLKENGYNLIINSCIWEWAAPEDAKRYRFAQFKCKGVRGGFCTFSNGAANPYLDNKIAVENANCFNKWSQAPICLPLPSNDEEFAFLLEQIEILASDEGLQKSDNFEYESVVRYL